MSYFIFTARTRADAPKICHFTTYIIICIMDYMGAKLATTEFTHGLSLN